MSSASDKRPDSAFLLVDTHSRECRVDDLGRLQVSVCLTKVTARAGADGTSPAILLASVAAPYCRDFYEKCMTFKGARDERFEVKRLLTRLSRGSKWGLTFVCYPPEVEGDDLEWSYRLSAAFPFKGIDLQYPRPDFWQKRGTISPELLARSYVLKIPSRRFVFTHIHPSEAASNAQYAIEESAHDELYMSHNWIEGSDATQRPKTDIQMTTSAIFEPARTPVGNESGQVHQTQVKEKRRDCLTVEAPRLLRRYTIALQPASLLPDVEIDTARRIAHYVLCAVRQQDFGNYRLVEELNSAFESALQNFVHSMDLLPENEPPGTLADISLRGFLWSTAGASDDSQEREDDGLPTMRHALLGFCGNVKSDHWARGVEYGSGLAGHAFRFQRVITYHRETARKVIDETEREDQLLLVERSEENQAWIIAVPIAIPKAETPLGVIRLAFRDEDLKGISKALSAVASRRTENCTKQLEQLFGLMNATLWQTLATSKEPLDAWFRKIAQVYYHHFLDREGSADALAKKGLEEIRDALGTVSAGVRELLAAVLIEVNKPEKRRKKASGKVFLDALAARLEQTAAATPWNQHRARIEALFQ